MFNAFLVHCLLCAVTSLPVKSHHTHIHVHATHVQVLSCCVVFCLHLVCLLNVYHPCHTHHCSWSSLYITCTTVPVLHVTFVHTYHATCPLCSPHVICLFQLYSTYTKPTCTCFTPTYACYLLFVHNKKQKRTPLCKRAISYRAV